MNQNKLQILYAKLVSRQISNTELDELLVYFETSDSANLETMIAQELESSRVPQVYSESAISTGQRMLTKLKTEIAKTETLPAATLKLWPRIAITAAVAVVVFGAGLFYYNQKAKQGTGTERSVNHDIAPGKQGATLTLANGKKIRLADAANGQLARQAGVTVTKLANGQLVYELTTGSEMTEKDMAAVNTLSTAKGESYQLRLPDGSMVWLNAASSLAYSANLLQAGRRKVKLTGEAYFEISKDKTHPFVVESRGQQVEVLGTRFNVSSYADEPNVKTTLLEGSVKLNGSILKPGEQATIQAPGSISISQVDLDEAVAWKNGKFIFADENIESIMRKLARWYNVEVSYVGVPPTQTFTASIGRFNNISKILDKLSYTNNVHFKIEGRRVTVMK